MRYWASLTTNILANKSCNVRSGVFRIWQGGHGERAEREPITGVWGRSPQRGSGAEPLVWGSGGEAPWSWNTFCFWMLNGNRKFAHFSEIWKRKRPSNIVEFCNSCWKMAKNAAFHIKSPVKNFHGRAKGGASHRAPLLNTPLNVRRPICCAL